MTTPINTNSIAEGTGKPFCEWFTFLESIGARDLSHTEIARRITKTGEASGWWAQTITVAYEQEIGRRVPGQDSSGHFSVSVTRTITGSMDEAIARWSAAMEGRSAFDGTTMSTGPTRNDTDKWRYWRCTLEDGTRVNVSAGAKREGKSLIAVSHEKLGNADEVERWRAVWKDALRALSSG